jgi:hypothetical protein
LNAWYGDAARSSARKQLEKGQTAIAHAGSGQKFHYLHCTVFYHLPEKAESGRGREKAFYAATSTNFADRNTDHSQVTTHTLIKTNGVLLQTGDQVERCIPDKKPLQNSC